MQRHPISYRATGRFAHLVCDYLEGATALQEFFPNTPDRKGLEAAMAVRTFDPAMRQVLCAALDRQYRGLVIDPAVRANLDLLQQDSTLTITTGHQLCLFTGPLYVPFKILNVVRLARALSTTKRPVVPVFWMATEDHDRAEIDHAWINGHRVHWPGEAGGAVGHLRLTGINIVLDEVDRLLGAGAEADAMRHLLRECYTEDATLAQATRRFVNALFGRFGVVIIDGDDPALKKAFAPIMQEELLNEVTARTVHYANEKLAGHYALQAHARDINLFHLRPGHRSRIVREDDHYRVLDGGPVFSVDALLAELEAHPERFSPNVLLRPVYQETVLPNIAYVGGGGEVAYWSQLRWLFQGMRVPMPVVMLRTSAAFVTAKEHERWKGLGLAVEDLFKPREELAAQVARSKATFSTELDKERAAHAEFYAALAQRVLSADPTLTKAVQAREARAAKGLDAIEAKLVRAAKRQQADALARLDQVLHGVFPSGLQERQENLLPRYVAQGPGFLDTLLRALDPLDPRFSVLVEEA
jgi:bacillithiol biosynthesis cysteine-adding enzyme BshC